jgi:hypothetical protein
MGTARILISGSNNRRIEIKYVEISVRCEYLAIVVQNEFITCDEIVVF